jgi:C4-dicarboxylate-specific signal transduction histidine kinase
MDSLRKVVAAMNASARCLSNMRKNRTRPRGRQSRSVSLGNMQSFSLLIIGFAMLHRENRSRAMAAKELAAAKTSLERGVKTRTGELAENN